MTNEFLLHVLGYIWAFFGASWATFNLLKKTGDSSGSGRLLRFGFLAITFVLLFVGRHKIPTAVLLVAGLIWAWLGAKWGAPSRAAQSGEFKLYRILRLFVLAVVFSLLFWNVTAAGILGKRFSPNLPKIGLLGFLLAVCGMTIALWSRTALGRYWSDKVIVQTEHRLIRNGPYSCMRHPLYSGVLLAVLGTALVLGEVRGLLSFVILLVNYAIKARREERILAERFGPEFNTHVARTGFLLPRLRRS
jgi:protein-S-isoprenylcysteine O-methyltransferase Ste14